MKVVKLKDICTKGSSSLKQKDVQNGNGQYPVYGASGIVGYIDSYHQEKEYIGIVKDGSGIGRVMFLPPKSSVIGTLQYILPKPGYDINYIGYCLKSLDLASHKQGAAIPHIYFKDYGEKLICIEESIHEQKFIVEKLNKNFMAMDQIIANTFHALEELEQYTQLTLNKFLQSSQSITEKSIKDICNIGRGKSRHRPRNEASLYGGIYPFIQTGDIREANGGTILEYKQTYSEKGLAQSKMWPKGTICMTIAANIGETAILGFDSCFPDSIVGISPKNNEISAEYLNYYLVHIRPQIVSIARGFAQKNINLELIGQIRIKYPTLSEQLKIVKILKEQNHKIDILRSNFNKICDKVNSLKQAILKETFE